MQIYVACLSSYNNGILHGAWVPASTDVEEMQDAVNDMLLASPMHSVEPTEEWAIHDYDAPVALSEYCGLEYVAKVAQFLEDAFDAEVAEAAIAVSGHVDDAARLLDNYVGHFETVEDLGYEYAEQLMEIPENIQAYFDYERYGRDLAYDMYEHNGHYFWCS